MFKTLSLSQGDKNKVILRVSHPKGYPRCYYHSEIIASSQANRLISSHVQLMKISIELTNYVGGLREVQVTKHELKNLTLYL